MNEKLDLQAAASLISPLYRDSVALITASYKAKPNGQIALTALPASIIVEKPRVTIELWKNNLTHDFVRDSRAFCVHLLRTDQLDLIRTFGFYHGQSRNKFDGLAYNLGSTLSPCLTDCLGWLDCRVIGQLPIEDMTIFVGDVVAAKRNSIEQPLTWTVARKTLPADWLDEYNQKIRPANEAWARQQFAL